ncbi:ribosome biogenesis GTPase Der [Candidatus Parcubacteria bacterium]|nr:MAG: ribosome biogenesis GTPase Der [Candidatus Parcubacteria bacterium]
MQKMPQIIIFGRTNVGKSTLFNILTEQQKALTSNIEGTTRDSNKGVVGWRGIYFTVIDTGGITDLNYLLKKTSQTSDIEARVQQKVKDYLKGGDIILFVVDVRAGLLPQDKELALALKKITKPTQKIILVANKADNPRLRQEAHSFYQLSLGEPLAVSAANGSGTGDLLDTIVNLCKNISSSAEPPLADLKICLLGKPNVGKSSLINKLINENRLIVSPTPRTTREPQDIGLVYNQQTIQLIDTAGIGRQSHKKVKQNKRLFRAKSEQELDWLSVQKSLSVLRRADIALLLLDITQPITKEEAKLAEEVIKNQKGLVIVANKWDLIEKRNTKAFQQYICRCLPFAAWAPILFVSALTGKGLKHLLPTVLKISHNRQKSIPQQELNQFLKYAVKKHPPTRSKGKKHPFIYSIQQTKINPPVFTVQIGANDSLHSAYLKFLENQLRQKFGYQGVPIKLQLTKKVKVHSMPS